MIYVYRALLCISALVKFPVREPRTPQKETHLDLQLRRSRCASHHRPRQLPTLRSKVAVRATALSNSRPQGRKLPYRPKPPPLTPPRPEGQAAPSGRQPHRRRRRRGPEGQAAPYLLTNPRHAQRPSPLTSLLPRHSAARGKRPARSDRAAGQRHHHRAALQPATTTDKRSNPSPRGTLDKAPGNKKDGKKFLALRCNTSKTARPSQTPTRQFQPRPTDHN